MHRSTGADAHNLQGGELLFHFACFKVYIDSSIQFVDDYINVIDSYAGGYHRDALAIHLARMHYKFAPVL